MPNSRFSEAINPASLYVVTPSPSHAAYPMTKLAANRELLRAIQRGHTPSDSGETEQPVPLSPDGTLLPGRLYPSSADDTTWFYLPEYGLHAENGRYTTTLKWRTPTDDPSGPLGWLTLTLTQQPAPAWPAPHSEAHWSSLFDRYTQLWGNPNRQRELIQTVAAETGYSEARLHALLTGQATRQPIPHQPIARLGYHLPIAASHPTLAGNWVNVDPNTSGLTRLTIGQTATGSTGYTFHGYGKCHPQDCDWGEIPAAPVTAGANQLWGSYNFGFKKTHLTIRPDGNELEATVVNDYADNDGRTDRTDFYRLRRADAPQTSPLLWQPLGALNEVENAIWRTRLPIYQVEEYDRLYQILTDPAFAAQLEIRSSGTVGYYTWRQFARWSARLSGINGRSLNLITPPSAIISHLDLGNIATSATATATLNSNLSDILANLGAAASLPTATISTNPAILDLIRHSDYTINLGHEQRPALPAGIYTNPNTPHLPALIRVPAEAIQLLTPFHFNPTTHAYLFDAPRNPSQNHILLPDTILFEGDPATFYRDSALRDQIYYKPQAFQLTRVADAPYEPDLMLLFQNVLAEEQLLYQVELTFHAQPQIDQRLLNIAQEKYGHEARFTPLNPISSTLLLNLPLDAANGTPQPITQEAAISFDEGIRHSVTLSDTEFERVMLGFRSPAGLGLTGTVQATLFDGTTAAIPVELSLTQTAGQPFNRLFLGPVDGQPGRYRVQLTNRLESPVHISSLYGVQVGTRFAYPQHLLLPNGTTASSATVQPGAIVTIEYLVAPHDGPVADITPLLESSVRINHAQLWPLLMFNEGYTSHTFELSLSIDAAFFTAPPPQGMAPLAGVRVEFEPATAVYLTPSHPTTTATLRMPLLPWLLQQDAQQYRYRVTNLHLSGDTVETGLATAWTTQFGNTPLTVTPAF